MTPPLDHLRRKAVPGQAWARVGRDGFRARIAIDRSAPQFGEPLEDLRALGIAGENFYHSERNPPYWQRIEGSIPHLLARQSVARELLHVNDALARAGLELFVFDAWRPRAVQRYFHDVWMPRELSRRHPALTGEDMRRAVERYWAAPTIDEASPAPHETGAALELTIRWIGGEPLWMGSLFDDVTDIAHRDFFERGLGPALRFSDEEARANRRLLHWAMAERDFAGHPDEWWHYSLGDQLWAALKGRPSAHYGLANFSAEDAGVTPRAQSKDIRPAKRRD